MHRQRLAPGVRMVVPGMPNEFATTAKGRTNVNQRSGPGCVRVRQECALVDAYWAPGARDAHGCARGTYWCMHRQRLAPGMRIVLPGMPMGMPMVCHACALVHAL